MSGKRILDAIALLRATQNVAYNHFALRFQQAELYGRTSSLTKAFAQRYPVTSSLVSQQFSQSSFNRKQEQGIQQDHHHERSEKRGEAGLSHRPAIKVEQAKANRHPLPDGTIPPAGSPIGQEKGDAETEYRRANAASESPLQSDSDEINPASSGKSTIPTPKGTPRSADDARIAQRASEDQIPRTSAEPPDFTVDQEKDVYYQPPGTIEPVLSALPRVKVPQIENDVQGGDEHIPAAKEINADVYYSGAEGSCEPTEEQLSQLFHSPRSARLVGKKDRCMPGVKREFHTSAVGRQNAEAEKHDLKQLAQDMASDVSVPLLMRDMKLIH